MSEELKEINKNLKQLILEMQTIRQEMTPRYNITTFTGSPVISEVKMQPRPSNSIFSMGLDEDSRLENDPVRAVHIYGARDFIYSQMPMFANTSEWYYCANLNKQQLNLARQKLDELKKQQHTN